MKNVLLSLMIIMLTSLAAWADNSVTVTYNGNTATVTVDDNVAPYLTVTQSGAHVSIAQSSSVAQEITYTLSGTSNDGEFYMSGSYKATIELNGLTLTNATPVYSGAAIHIQNGKRINVKVITGTTNTLTDAASGSQSGCLYVKGHPEFKQQGTLNIVGNAKHGIKAGDYLSIKNATINITSAVDDGISCNQYFLMESGTVNISGTGDDGIQCDLDGDTSTGMTTNHEDEDSGNLYISGGTITIHSDAIAAKGIKCMGDAYISGTAVIDVTTTGKGEWDTTDQETNSACGLSADGDINISGGDITLKATGSGGKGMKSDNVINISGGNITVSTSGGLYYNNGTTENTNYTGNTDQIDSKYYSSAKGIKAGYKESSLGTASTICHGGINISGGTLYVTTTGRNAEGIESKNYLNVTGGETTIDAYDDGINAAQDLYITDGYFYARSSNNDGIDANGNVVIEGGLVYAIGAAAPEVAIDANSEENKKFHFNGGVLITIGGLEQGSTLSQTCYQTSSVSSNTWYSMTYGGNVIAFLTPTVSSSGSGGGPGGGGPGGGGSSGLVISAPSTPTLKSGVTISNGTPVFNGPKCYVDATVTGGSNVSLSQYSSGGGSSSGSYTVTATANPTAGGTVTGAGTYTAHTLCTLTATANTGYTFENWTRNGSVASTDPTYSFYVTENSTCVANFSTPPCTITASANPAEGGDVKGEGTYNQGSIATLKAIAHSGYAFTNWTMNGTQVSTDNPYSFTVTGDATFLANFIALQQHTVTCNTTQNGSISASPTSAYMGEVITLTATPASGYYLASWTVKDANNNIITVTNNQFTMPDSHVTVSATFVVGYNVNLTPATNGTISANPTGGPAGTTITLTATPATGYVFDSWVVYQTGDVTSTVTVTNNTFELPAHDVTVVGIFTVPQGGDVTIGSGTGTNAYIPTYAYYNYTLSQQIYMASEVGAAGTITAVAFKVSNSKSTTRSIDIYLSHTTKSAFSYTSNGGWSSSVSSTDWVAQSTTYRVFSGSVTFNASDWTTITLDTPFGYDGTSNLLLTVDDNTGSYVSSGSDSPQFYVYSTSGYTALYKYNDNTDYNPASMSVSGTPLQTNNQVMFTKEVPSTDGYLSVSPTSLTGFEATYGGTASNAQSLAVIGRNLQANLTVTAPSGYEVSTASDGTYNGTLTLTPSNGSIQANVFVRLSSVVSPGSYNGNMTLTSGTTSASVSLNGTVTSSADMQTYTLSQGWNWWSSNQVITLEQLESAVENYTASIVAQNGTVNYLDGFGWDGDFTTLNLSKMYKMYFEEATELTLTAPAINPADQTITINKGTNWIAFPLQQSMSVSEALAGFTNKTSGDRLKSSNGFVTLLGNDYWPGGFTTLEPGQGYIYVAKGSDTQTFTYPSGTSKGVVSDLDATHTSWTAQRARFASSMDLLATVEIDGVEQTSDELEIGAFVGDECRGAIKLQYVEPLGKHIAFLTVSGENGETVRFKALSNGKVIDLQETVTIQLDELLGDAKAPFVLHAGNNELTLFPNPANKGEAVQISLNGLSGATVEIYNALGVLVRKEVLSQDSKELSGFHTAGIYTVRVVDQQGNVQIGKMVVR